AELAHLQAQSVRDQARLDLHFRIDGDVDPSAGVHDCILLSVRLSIAVLSAPGCGKPRRLQTKPPGLPAGAGPACAVRAALRPGPRPPQAAARAAVPATAAA